MRIAIPLLLAALATAVIIILTRRSTTMVINSSAAAVVGPIAPAKDGLQRDPAVSSTPEAQPQLNYFTASEFGTWWPHMSQELLQRLDKFRELWGAPVVVSSNPDALGRHLGASDTSQHNVDRWGEVRGADVFPAGLNAETAARAKQIAQQVGFTGFGIYSDTSPGWMMHLDVRPDRTATNPATWARVDHEYVGLNEVIA